MRSSSLLSIFYSAYSIVTNVRKNLFLHIISVFTVLICFFVMATGLDVFFNIRSMLNLTKMRTHVSVYLDQELDAAGLTEFRQQYCMGSFIAHCQYVSIQEAKQRFSEKNPDLKDTLSSLDENPFPPSVEIDFEKDFKNVETLRDFSKTVTQAKHAIYVDDGGKWVANWLQVLNLFDKLTTVLAIGFSLLVAFVISNTIQLLVYSRKDEVEILSLVGATRNMIRLPFLLEGTLHGFVGAILAIIAVKFTFLWVFNYLHQIWPGLLPDQIVFLPWNAQASLIVMAGIIGWCGSFMAVGRFLK